MPFGHERKINGSLQHPIFLIPEDLMTKLGIISHIVEPQITSGLFFLFFWVIFPFLSFFILLQNTFLTHFRIILKGHHAGVREGFEGGISPQLLQDRRGFHQVRFLHGFEDWNRGQRKSKKGKEGKRKKEKNK
jgi:hypothetical protein